MAIPCLSADDKPGTVVDSKKLIGKWEWGNKENRSWIVFTPDGSTETETTKVRITVRSTGKYTLEGDKLTFINKDAKDKEIKGVVIITKLTDNELEYRNSADFIESFKRAKTKKK
jgi:uncharacterized protein (TIGR03066 family)